MKYCLFGGSFDPPHEGHRHLARTALETFRLDCMIWVPAASPPLKDVPRTPFAHRLAMARLLAAGLPGGHQVSDVEARLPTPSYSLQTIRALKAELGEDHAWHFLIGSDNWALFPKWHRWQDVLREVTLIVYPRQGHPLGQLPEGVLALDLPEIPWQSSAIRKTLAETRDFNAAGVPVELRGYISAHGLYGMGPLSAQSGVSPGVGE